MPPGGTVPRAQRYFAWLADAHIAVREMALADELGELFPEERAYVTRAVPRRAREFAAGRTCARQAMATLGYPSAAIPAGADRAPCWPDGLIGSITHTADHCAAAVARRGDGYRAIGLDLEPALALPPELIDTVCLPAEKAWLQDQPPSDRPVLARAIFSAKECAYKAQYPLSRQMLEFHELHLALDMQRGRFAATLLRDCPPFAMDECIAGRFRIERGHIACAVALRDPRCGA